MTVAGAMIQSMGDVMRYRPRQSREEATSSMGMVIFLGSWAMLFAAMLFAYGFVRARLPAWPPEGVPPLPWRLPLGSTLVLALSSFAYQQGVRRVRKGRVAGTWPWLAGASFLGAAFLALQTVLWMSLVEGGFLPGSAGAFSSVFYGLTALHALHALVGVAGVSYVAVQSFAGAYSPARYLPLRLWGLYWHFMAAVWLVMFITIFVL